MEMWKIEVNSLWTAWEGEEKTMRVTAVWIEYEPESKEWEPLLQAVWVGADGTPLGEAGTYEMSVWVKATQPQV